MDFDEVAKNLPAIFSGLLVAILFVQSGLDKVFDWKGNLEWLTGHFSKTFLARFVPVMFATITILEVATGVIAAAGVIYYLVSGSLTWLFVASILGAGAITALFFGQRVAKDYPGAAVLVPYFLLAIVLMVLTNPFR
jgi:hypothetical protein